MLDIRRMHSTSPGFWEELERFTTAAAQGGAENDVERTVRDIIADVRRRGDAAVLEYTRRFDRRQAGAVRELAIHPRELRAAFENLDEAPRTALEQAAARIRSYHEREVAASWSYEDELGTLLGQKITAIERVGLYVPGGRAAYPSSVLMNALPARVAGVGEIVMVVPAPGDVLNELVLAAAHVAGVDRAFSIGGAQAVAALAYGTESIPRVDKIVGPGNIFVATAKRLVYGDVGIDMIAGPSEVVVVCDGATPEEWIAMDLFAQAEHDEDARAVLVSPDAEYLERVQAQMQRLLPGLERREIIQRSLEARGALIAVRDLAEAARVVNVIAPEHLELSVEEPEALLADIRHAGAVFMGRYSAEVLGDYCAGPNHVLPTARTARFSSPLGVYDFQKRSSLVRCSPEGAARLGRIAAELARGEDLTAHARSAELRIKADDADEGSGRSESVSATTKNTKTTK